MKRKILFLAHSQSIHTKRWVKYFIDKKWDVHVISFHPEQISGSHHHYLNTGAISPRGGNYQYFKKIFRIIYLIYSIKPDIINAHYLTSFGFLAYLSFFKKQCITVYGSDIYLDSRKNFIYKFLSKRVLSRAVHIFSVSDKMTSFIQSYFNIDSSKITTILYGIDTKVFKRINSTENRKYTFITHRLMVENSNYPIIIDVLHRLRQKQIQFNALIIGNGPLRGYVEETVKAKGLQDMIEIIDPVSKEDLVRLFNDAMFYLSFTQSDGTPLSVIEAAACGIFPVLSANDANMELINKGMKGVCLDLKDVLRIVSTLETLISNSNPHEFQTANSEFVNKYMSYDQNMAIIEDKMISLL